MNLRERHHKMLHLFLRMGFTLRQAVRLADIDNDIRVKLRRSGASFATDALLADLGIPVREGDER